MTFKIIIEGSRTPIYRRIINGLAHSLETKHHQTITIEPGTESPLEFARRINAQQPDLVIISNLFGLLSMHEPGAQKYCYELLDAPIAFLHYDNLLGPFSDWNEIKRRLNAFVGISDRSSHFCIKDSNIADFQKLSTGNAYKISHASEFDLVDTRGKYRYNLSFVGHVLPESLFLNSIDPDNPFIQKVLAAYNQRLQHLNYRIEESAISFADQVASPDRPVIDWLSAKQAYRAHINRTSLYFRGHIISDVADTFDVDVIGGDPSYINDKASTRQLEHVRVHLHTPDRNHKGTDRIYAESRININITSVQFDAAIVNRVLDVGAVGGFLLTDWKDSLKEITSVHEQIAYRTIGELKNKIDYYLTHDKERLEIAAQLHHDVKQKCSYDFTTETILASISGQI